MSELKPCPFCGNPYPTITVVTEGIRIKCPNCNITFKRDFYDGGRGGLELVRSIEAWNMRAKGEDDIKPLSNADYIRAMSDKEMAHWMSVDFCHGQAEKPLLKWLKAPVEEGYYD